MSARDTHIPKTLAVIGAGAAGMFCAVNAARLAAEAGVPLRVLVLEKTARPLAKVRISGGGRCNLAHACYEPRALAACYPRGEAFVRKMFGKFATRETLAWFAERGVPTVAEDDGRIFPRANTSQAVIDCLLAEADRYGVEIAYHAGVDDMAAIENGFLLKTKVGDIPADYVCYAAGGSPSGAGMDWLERLGHRRTPPVPSLFTFNAEGHPITALAGVACPAEARITGTNFRFAGPLLVTHWGLSGPAVLKLSAFAAQHLAEAGYRFQVQIDFCPDMKEEALRAEMHAHRQQYGARQAANGKPGWLGHLPNRLWLFLLDEAGIEQTQRWAEVPAKAANRLLQALKAYRIDCAGKTTYKDEFVTAGGIVLEDVDPLTLASRLVANLFFAGEALDVDGITGGFNFTHAWASGYLAAGEVVRRATPSSPPGPLSRYAR